MKKLLLLPALFLALSIMAESKTTRIDKNLTIYTDVMRQLDINYVDTLNYDELIKTSINAMLRQVDPYTIYIPESEDDDLRMMTTGKYGGIGAIIVGAVKFSANIIAERLSQKYEAKLHLYLSFLSLYLN